MQNRNIFLSLWKNKKHQKSTAPSFAGDCVSFKGSYQMYGIAENEDDICIFQYKLNTVTGLLILDILWKH